MATQMTYDEATKLVDKKVAALTEETEGLIHPDFLGRCNSMQDRQLKQAQRDYLAENPELFIYNNLLGEMIGRLEQISEITEEMGNISESSSLEDTNDLLSIMKKLFEDLNEFDGLDEETLNITNAINEDFIERSDAMNSALEHELNHELKSRKDTRARAIEIARKVIETPDTAIDLDIR